MKIDRNATAPADMALCRAWQDQHLSAPGDLPIAFRLDGAAVAGIPADWSPVAARRRIDANIVETVYEGCAPGGGIRVRVECVAYADYPVVEWTAWFTNAGSDASPVLSDVMALDAVAPVAGASLWHCNGDFYSAAGYTACETALEIGAPVRFAPDGGRPCDQAFPYFRLAGDGGGVSLAVGWPAQWAASFAASAEGVRVTAGQERTHLRLLPGETIRTPRIALMTWTGDATRAANLWRRWHYAHVMPRSNGAPLGPRLVGHGTDEGEEFTEATTQNQMRYMARWAEHGIAFDTWWIDAGWYPCRTADGSRSWPETGTWVPDPERFPDGFAAVSESAARHGADLLVWFEPERVRTGTALDQPGWLLQLEGECNHLLDLGNPECRQALTDHVCDLIQRGGIRIYRQDHNFAPLEFWRRNEPADRQGLHENLHVQGYLQYWDDLLARNPGLWIDSCASGGRRNDLETMRRSVPLHYTDYGYGEHPVKLSFHHVLFQWMPYFKEVTLSWDLDGPARFDHAVDRFSYHCGFGPMMTPALDMRRDDYDFALVREMVGIWKRAAPAMLHGDYTPLTPVHRSAAEWVARQFDLAAEGWGFVQAIRLPANEDPALTVHLCGLDGEAAYHLENPETGETRTVAGSALATDGLVVEAPQRGAAIWFYRRAD